MSSPPSLPNDSEETEIDRLLLELGIELPALEPAADDSPAQDANSEYRAVVDDSDRPHDENDAVSFCLPHPQARFPPWPPETES